MFGVLKLQFGFVKVRYRRLAKANRLFATCARMNLFMVRTKLLYSAALCLSRTPTTGIGESRRPRIACENERTGLHILLKSFPGLRAAVVQRFPSDGHDDEHLIANHHAAARSQLRWQLRQLLEADKTEADP